MLHSPITPHRSAFIDELKRLSDEELLELLYTCLRWINYFQDGDTQYTYRKIYHDVRNEVKIRGLRYRWSRQDAKKYRILAQKMYYGALSFNELEWRLGFIIMYTLPACRNIVKDKMHLVRETIHVIIDCIHDHHRWSYLEYNKELLKALDVPFFSFETLGIMYRLLKGLFLLSENVLIFFLLLCQTGLTILRPVWNLLDPDYRLLKSIMQIIEIFLTVVWVTYYLYDP